MSDLPAKMIPIAWAFCRGIEIVADAVYVPRSAASPESSDCAGLIALPSNRPENGGEWKNLLNYLQWI